MAMISEMEIEVRSTELDALGHVNQAKWVEYLEWGRYDWMRASGLTGYFLGGEGVGSVMANLNVDFRREARLGDRLTVRTWLAAVGRSSFRFGQEVRGAGGDVLCGSVATAVTFDMRARAAVPIPDALRATLESLVHTASEDGG
ncbi:MAG TPA: thioesterase family protein [Longimicrobium sp.]|nr:thioesterase family protein [Longimicrobium sp.]